MNILFKAIAGAMITVVLCLFLSKNNKDYSVVISIAICCLIVIASVTYLKPVIDFTGKLKRIGQLDSEALEVVIKSVGIGLLTEIATMICDDAGNKTLSKALNILSGAAILWLSIPLLESLLELLETILVSL